MIVQKYTGRKFLRLPPHLLVEQIQTSLWLQMACSHFNSRLFRPFQYKDAILSVSEITQRRDHHITVVSHLQIEFLILVKQHLHIKMGPFCLPDKKKIICLTYRMLVSESSLNKFPGGSIILTPPACCFYIPACSDDS